MKVVTAQDVKDKKVLLRLDIDVPLIKDGSNFKIGDEYRLESGLDTLELCLENASSVIIMGHIGRPEGEDPSLSVKPIVQWLETQYPETNLEEGALHVLENLRFEKGEKIDPASARGTADEQVVLDFAKELASLGEIFINESFAAYHSAASTTVLPTLIPSYAGLRFKREVDEILAVKNNPERPLVAILGGAKLEDKLPVVDTMSKIADIVLVGGKLASEMRAKLAITGDKYGKNVYIANLTEDGQDINEATIEAWRPHLESATEIIWNGPLGKVEDPKNLSTQKIAEIIINTQAKTIIGGGDTVAALDKWGMLDKFSFVSTGGGAMLKLLVDGTLPTIQALE